MRDHLETKSAVYLLHLKRALEPLLCKTDDQDELLKLQKELATVDAQRAENWRRSELSPI